MLFDLEKREVNLLKVNETNNKYIGFNKFHQILFVDRILRFREIFCQLIVKVRKIIRRRMKGENQPRGKSSGSSGDELDEMEENIIIRVKGKCHLVALMQNKVLLRRELI